MNMKQIPVNTEELEKIFDEVSRRDGPDDCEFYFQAIDAIASYLCARIIDFFEDKSFFVEGWRTPDEVDEFLAEHGYSHLISKFHFTEEFFYLLFEYVKNIPKKNIKNSFELLQQVYKYALERAKEKWKEYVEDYEGPYEYDPETERVVAPEPYVLYEWFNKFYMDYWFHIFTSEEVDSIILKELVEMIPLGKKRTLFIASESLPFLTAVAERKDVGFLTYLSPPEVGCERPSNDFYFQQVEKDYVYPYWFMEDTYRSTSLQLKNAFIRLTPSCHKRGITCPNLVFKEDGTFQNFPTKSIGDALTILGERGQGSMDFFNNETEYYKQKEFLWRMGSNLEELLGFLTSDESRVQELELGAKLSTSTKREKELFAGRLFKSFQTKKMTKINVKQMTLPLFEENLRNGVRALFLERRKVFDLIFLTPFIHQKATERENKRETDEEEMYQRFHELKENGTLFLTVPTDILSRKEYQKMRKRMKEKFELAGISVTAIINMPPSFVPHEDQVNTSILILQKTSQANEEIFIAEIPESNDVVDAVRYMVEKYQAFLSGEKEVRSHSPMINVIPQIDLEEEFHIGLFSTSYFELKQRIEESGKEIKKLPDICEIVSSEDLDIVDLLPLCSSEKEEGFRPFIQTTDLKDGKVDLSFIQYFPDEQSKNYKLGVCQKNDTLFCVFGPVGKTALVDESSADSVVSPSIVVLRPKSSVDPVYFQFSLHSKLVREQIHHLSEGDTVRSLSFLDLNKLEIPIHSLTWQKEFSQKIKSLKKELKKLEEKQRKTKGKLDTLISEVGGEK